MTLNAPALRTLLDAVDHHPDHFFEYLVSHGYSRNKTGMAMVNARRQGLVNQHADTLTEEGKQRLAELAP